MFRCSLQKSNTSHSHHLAEELLLRLLWCQRMCDRLGWIPHLFGVADCQCYPCPSYPWRKFIIHLFVSRKAPPADETATTRCDRSDPCSLVVAYAKNSSNMSQKFHHIASTRYKQHESQLFSLLEYPSWHIKIQINDSKRLRTTWLPLITSIHLKYVFHPFLSLRWEPHDDLNWPQNCRKNGAPDTNLGYQTCQTGVRKLYADRQNTRVFRRFDAGQDLKIWRCRCWDFSVVSCDLCWWIEWKKPRLKVYFLFKSFLMHRFIDHRKQDGSESTQTLAFWSQGCCLITMKVQHLILVSLPAQASTKPARVSCHTETTARQDHSWTSVEEWMI